jgi:hypothetical protein
MRDAPLLARKTDCFHNIRRVAAQQYFSEMLYTGSSQATFYNFKLLDNVVMQAHLRAPAATFATN